MTYFSAVSLLRELSCTFFGSFPQVLGSSVFILLLCIENVAGGCTMGGSAAPGWSCPHCHNSYWGIFSESSSQLIELTSCVLFLFFRCLILSPRLKLPYIKTWYDTSCETLVCLNTVLATYDKTKALFD